MSTYTEQHSVPIEDVPWPVEEHFDKGIQCSRCGEGFLNWKQIQSDESRKLHWRLFDDAGNRHYCNKFTNNMDRLNDGI